MSAIIYEVQYNRAKDTLWVHSSEGETVGRFSSKFGMDIHRTIKEQLQENGNPCLCCTHTKPTLEDFRDFCNQAFKLWGVRIDRSMIILDTSLEPVEK